VTEPKSDCRVNRWYAGCVDHWAGQAAIVWAGNDSHQASTTLQIRTNMALKKVNLNEVTVLIRTRRRELGLTQKQLGEKLGIDQRTVSSLEKNPGSISVNRFFAVLDALQVNVFSSTDPRDESSLARLTVDQLFRNAKIV
jgi:HTH-type transcriptional regulator/antitoxin HipB